MSDFVEVAIDSVRVSLMSPQRMVILKQKDSERYLPVWVGPYEAEAITVALQEIEMARPLTHDLLKNIIGVLNAKIQRIEIVALREDIFYGNIVVEVDGKSLDVDARPSDSIALAIRSHVSIYVHKDVMEQAGIIPEADLPEGSAQADEKGEKPPVPDAADEKRLSIFEDFLSQIDVDDKPDQPEDGESEPDQT